MRLSEGRSIGQAPPDSPASVRPRPGNKAGGQQLQQPTYCWGPSPIGDLSRPQAGTNGVPRRQGPPGLPYPPSTCVPACMPHTVPQHARDV